MANITRELQAIEEAIYGEEVRGSIHDAISKINDVSESSDTTAQNANITAESAKATAQNAEKIAEIKSGTAVTSVTSPITGIVKGEMYFNTNTNDLWKCNGVGWDLIGNLKGVKGDKGEDAPKPTGIVLVSQVGLIKTYNITFSDGSTFPFQVSDGASGTGTGDMLKAVYDRDNSGVIDAAETLVEKTSGKIGQTAVLVQLTKDTDGDLNFEGKKIKGEGGTGGATLRITTTEPDFIGKAVRATLQSGSTSSAYFMTSTFDDDGKCEITVNEVGTYKISVTDDKEYSVTKDIPYFGIYTGIMLAKFRANIPVTVNGGVSVGEGAIVTASDGTATYTATTGIDGTCTIQVGKSGVYTIKATKGGVTTDSTSTSTIATNGQTASLVTLSFASITLNYTCESSITYEVKKGTFSKTGADTSSGSETFLVPSLGEYQIICTIDGNQVTASVNLTSYANKSASVQAPAGGFSGWVKTRFPSSTATSLSDLTEAQIRELMTVHTSQDKLYEWLSATPADFSQFASNRVAMKWIGLRDRICDKLMGVSTILTAMLSSTHWEYILKDSVPKMTSNSLPEGEASASTELSTTYQAYKAFNGTTTDADDCWHSKSTTSGYIRYKFNSPICIKKVVMQNRNSTDATKLSTPKDFTIRVSNDASTWTELGSFSNSNNTSNAKTNYDVASNSGYFTYAEMTITTSNGSTLNIGELNFYGRALNESVPVMTDNTLPIGEAYESNNDPSNTHPWYAFNGIVSGSETTISWWGKGFNNWLAYAFTKPIKVNSAYILPAYSTWLRLKNYRIDASDNKDFSTFETLYTGVFSSNTSGVSQQVFFNNEKAFKYYRIFCIDNHSTDGSTVAIKELNFYGVSYSEEEFGTDGIEMLYDNGVEFKEIITGLQDSQYASGTTVKQSDSIVVTATGTYTPYALANRPIDSDCNFLISEFKENTGNSLRSVCYNSSLTEKSSNKIDILTNKSSYSSYSKVVVVHSISSESANYVGTRFYIKNGESAKVSKFYLIKKGA